MAGSSKPDPQVAAAAKPPANSRKKAAGALDSGAKPLKILLVDHSKTMRSILKSTLRQLGPVEFLEAGDGVEALDLIAQKRTFDLGIIDWDLRGIDGSTLVERIRQTDRRTPLIMCTTEADKPHILKALKAGVNNYLVKPFASELLIEKVQATLKKAGEAHPDVPQSVEPGAPAAIPTPKAA
jgi:two-component system chemotaxis response regulator CheY